MQSAQPKFEKDQVWSIDEEGTVLDDQDWKENVKATSQKHVPSLSIKAENP